MTDPVHEDVIVSFAVATYIITVFKLSACVRMTAHKFKIGEIVGYTPPRGAARVVRSTFTIVGFLPAVKDKPMYRIRRDESGAEHVVREGDLYRF